ncbi:alkaline phosphatase D family protein [Sungkyunkwania multivorans]|uniref:Alkaline phosphatase D family protein n=1 Tax=Sungkyunkwania multivorans TaxID=1173618 RepID=A0ABW3CWW7_9FLAO
MKKACKILCFLICGSLHFGTFAQDVMFDFVIAFGSCNDENRENVLWTPILKQQPNLWIWGGDNIYSTTDNLKKKRMDYLQQSENGHYVKVRSAMSIMGTWDDRDYGKKDGGGDYGMKQDSQQLFLDFLGLAPTHPLRQREGVYTSKVFETSGGSVKIIILDTRYFRTDLNKSDDEDKRYEPNTYGEGSILGEAQWQWLQTVLSNSEADFNVIVSSIQVLSGEHGNETWANFPHEQERLFNLIRTSKAKRIFILSGDRHFSEFSKKQLEGMAYPLIDFTSSGLTHTLRNFKGEPNRYRIGELISEVSFGLLKFDFESKTVMMEMRGKHNALLQDYPCEFPQN